MEETAILSKQTSNQITLLSTHFTLPFIFTLLLLIQLFPLFIFPFTIYLSLSIGLIFWPPTHFPPVTCLRNLDISTDILYFLPLNQVFYSNTFSAASWYKVDLIWTKSFIQRYSKIFKDTARYSGLVFHSPNSVRSLFIVFLWQSWGQCVHVRFMNREIGSCRFFEWAITWNDWDRLKRFTGMFIRLAWG